jgi:hypothetical protein
MLAGRRHDKNEWWRKMRRELEYISTLISKRRWRGKNRFEGSAEGGLSKVAHEFVGRSPRGCGDRASGSVGTRWAVSIVMFFAINSE